MSENKTAPNDWEACPPGNVQQLVSGLRGRQRIRRFKTLSGISAIVLLLIVAGNFGLTQFEDRGPDFAGVSCRHVMDLAEDFLDGKLSNELATKVAKHTEKCHKCRAEIARMKADQKTREASNEDAAQKMEQKLLSAPTIAAR